MATAPKTPGANPPEPRRASSQPGAAADVDRPQPAPPSSRPLQIFLLAALLVTGAAYVVDEWSSMRTEDITAKTHNKLRRLVANQSKFLTETDLGRKAEAKKKYEEAVLHYRRALIGEVNAEGRLNLGNALFKQGNPDMAFSQFREALNLDPNMVKVYTDWGHALTLQGKLDEAVQLYQEALRHNSNFAEVHYEFALVLEQQLQAVQADLRAAEAENQAQALAKSAAEAQLLKSDALKHYAAAERGGLNTPEFWSSYGNLLNNEGKFAEAETCLSKAVALQPGLGTAQFQLAVAQDRKGKYADAVAHYEATLAAIPDDPATLNNLALLYATATNPLVRSSKMAILLGTRACDATTSQNARYMDTLARAYAADNDFVQAIAWEDKAVHRATQLGDHDLLRELQPRFSLFVQHKTQ